MSMFDLLKLLAVTLRGYPRVTMDEDVSLATVLDVLVRPTVPFEGLRRNATLLNIGPLQIPVASVEHQIAMKTGTGRGKDKIDIEEPQKNTFRRKT